MKKILILSEESNDLSELLLRSCSAAKFVPYAHAAAMCWDSYDSIAVLARNHDAPYTMRPPLRMKLDKAMAEKKSVFCEFLSSWGMTYTRKSMNQITHQRLVYRDWAGEVEGLTSGDVMDGRYNDCYNYMFFDPSVRPILTYHDYVSAHDHIEMSEETFRSGLPALWFADENTLICGFRLCNFRRARFAPAESWKSIVRYVVTFLAGEAVDCDFLPPVCSHKDISVLTEEELQMIHKRMAQMGTTNREAYMRKMAIDGYVIRLELPEFKEYVAMQRVYSKRFNEIAKRVNETGRLYPEDVAEMKEMISKSTAQMDLVLAEVNKLK